MNSVYDKVFTNRPICSVFKNQFDLFTIYHYFSIRGIMSWNIRDNRNLFLKLKSKLGLCHVVLTTPKTSPEQLTLTIVKMQQLPNVENSDSKEQISRVKRATYNGRRKVCVNFQTDTDNLNIVVSGYRNNLYLKDNGVDLKMTENESLVAKRFHLLSYIDIFYKRCILLYETIFLKLTKAPSKMDVVFLMSVSDCTRTENVL